MTVYLHGRVKKYLARLNESQLNRILNALEKLSLDPPEGDIKSLSGQTGYWRLRIGNLRALYRIENGAIFVTDIDPRGQAYNKKNRRK
jgi:mRNA-degrading endonuclease RelE of RelBE toxin-antitoxin system